MNAAAWGALVSAAVGFALSPISIIELILVLFSNRRTVNSIVFVGTLVALSAVGVAMGYAGQQAGGGGEGETSTGAAILFVLLGLGLLALGVQNWRNRADTSEPAVVGTIGRMGPAPVAFLALGATLVNPKNLVLLLAAGQTIASATSGGNAVVAGAIFVSLATLPYTGAAAYAVFGGDSAHERLDGVRQALIEHNRSIVGIVATLIGMVLAAKGVAALL
jgi:hypothetical protein